MLEGRGQKKSISTFSIKPYNEIRNFSDLLSYIHLFLKIFMDSRTSVTVSNKMAEGGERKDLQSIKKEMRMCNDLCRITR